MPEAAEVEIVRAGLARVIGDELLRVEVLDPKLELDPTSLVGQRISDLRRFGKWLFIDLDNRQSLRLHLRLSGQLILSQREEPFGSDRLLIRTSSATIHFRDQRRFATADLVASSSAGLGLGPDLLNASFELERAESTRAIKTYLLDQAVVAGIGNYLVDEALWRVRVSPLRPASELDPKLLNRAVAAAKAVALTTLAAGGVSIRDYLNTNGVAGSGQNDLDCYGRAGAACRRCQATLEKTRVGGRGTTFCPDCQAY